MWEVSWRWRQTATYGPKVLLTIAALLPHLGWGCSTVGHWGPQALSLQADSHAGILSPTDSNSNWNWHKPSVVPGYIIVSCPPASTVPLLIYTGASLDWRSCYILTLNRASRVNLGVMAIKGHSTILEIYNWYNLVKPWKPFYKKYCPSANVVGVFLSLLSKWQVCNHK